jgi:hypothetical protein
MSAWVPVQTRCAVCGRFMLSTDVSGACCSTFGHRPAVKLHLLTAHDRYTRMKELLDSSRREQVLSEPKETPR